MNPYKAEGRADLMDAVEDSSRKLEPFRRAFRKLLKRAAGSEWFPNGSNEDVPVNQMSQAERAILQRLVGGQPRPMVIAGNPDLDAMAADQTLALEKVAEQVRLRRKLRRLVQNALYGGLGICRIGMTQDRSVPIREIAPELDEEGEVGVGKLLLEVISLENWVHDMQADTPEEAEFCGHSYWVDAESIGKYLPGVSKKDLAAEEKRWIDEQGGEMAGAISRGSEGYQGGEQKYWLWDLWMRHKNVIVTTPVGGNGRLARVRPWNSRPGGPYLPLVYRELCDQAMPANVMADVALVHDSLNSTFRKLIDQTREQKTVLGFKPGHEDDAQRIIDAASRAVIQMRDPTAVAEFRFNGPDQALLGMFLQTREIASIIGGNTDVLAGLGSAAPTLGQEQMVDSNASGGVESMEIDTAEFVTELFEAMRWYLYHEQMEPIQIVKEIAGTNIRVADEWSAMKAASSGVRFDAYSMQIEPYSLVYRSPEQRLALIVQWWREVVMPALQMGIGQAPDMEKLNAIGSRYANLPELKGILRIMRPEEMAAMGGGRGGDARQSPVTTRNYVRRSGGGPNRAGQAMQAMQMMGQGQETGAMMG